MPSKPRKHPSLVALGRAIRERRERLGLSQEEFGFEAGVHRTYVGGIERGERNPTVITLGRIAEVLKTTAGRILRESESLLDTK